MKFWKRGAIVFVGIDIILLFAQIDDYYEFFIKDCRDAFPFGHCPWGGEAMGWGWRNADVYLSGMASTGAILLFFIPLAIYCLCHQQYKYAFMAAISPIIISWLKGGLEYIMYYYA
ncbi:MAG: hypothetical protein MJ170_03665 [Alphaproteobacteria bacterium]|nr:hypothetical protein [Alphaproteobacteria bacterium]